MDSQTLRTARSNVVSLKGANPPMPDYLAALYMYSSGSTGKPKRVTRTHVQLSDERKALAATIHLTESDRILCTVPLYHAHGFCNCLLAALLTGGTLVIVPGEFNPRETLRALSGESITIYPAVPFMFKMLTEVFIKNMPDLRQLRLVFSAGAAMPEQVGQRFEEIYGVPVRQLYGSTETGAISINLAGGAGTETSVGMPLVGYRIDILDESGTPARQGEVGLVAIRSPAMAHQYDGLPEMTAECFVGSYFLPGDMGCKDELGNLYIKGRKKLMINVAGNKVDPLDVEAVIGRHAKVSEVVVVGEADPIYGERVKAVVVANEACEASEIIRYCATRLAEYKVPRQVEFRSDIPRSPLGKILRKYL
jgi:long-chain acyl-CoA synthetase